MQSPVAGTRRGPARHDVERYWERAHDEYLAHVGTTFQAGRIRACASVHDSNAWLGRAAGLGSGQRVLDAGCGVCGPAIDIARDIPGLRIVAITLVRRQAITAAGLVASAGLSDRIHVLLGDFHAPPLASGSFDAVLFLESVGYADTLLLLFENVRRLLRPGGTLYIKDVFRREPLWCDQEREELAEFDRVFAQRTPALTECVDAVRRAGFVGVTSRDLKDLVSTAHARQAMFGKDGRLTSFGHRHYRRHSCLPVCFGELTARAPVA